MKKTISFSLKTIIAILFFHLLATSDSFAALNGLSYTINPGLPASATNYQSIASAVSDLTSGTRADGGPVQGPGISGQVEITVTASSYTYTGTLNITAITGAGTSGDSVIINGGSAAISTLEITSSSGNNYLVQFDNCSYVTIENFTITSTLTAGYTFDGVIIEGPTSGSPVSHDDVINCTINMLYESAAASLGGAEFSGIVVNGFATGDGNLPNISGYFTNIYLTENTITDGHNGIVVFGSGATPSGVTITGNTITGFSSFGLDLLNIINPKIRNNVINGCVASNLAEAIGMNTAYNPSSTTDWTEISGNFITSQGRYAILLNGAGGNSSQPTRIYNNMVYSYSTTLTAVRPITFLNSNNGYINIWDNSIIMNTPSTNTSGALSIESATNNIDIRNNIFDYIGGSTGLPLYITTSSWVTNCDYNIFYNSSPTPSNEANIGGTLYTNTTVVGGGGFNSHSVVANPNFVNTTYGSQNLHITALPASTCNRGDGSTITSSPMAVTTDYDGQTRATPPNIGADELIVTVSPATASICSGGPQTLTATPGTPWTPSSYSWSPSGATGSTCSATPTVNTTYTVSAIDANGCTAAQGTSAITIISCGPNVYNMSGNGSSANPAVTLCASGLTLGMMNADAGVTYNLIQGTSTVVSTNTPSTSGAFNFSYTPVAGYTYTVTATSTSTITMNGSVTVITIPATPSTPSGTTSLCQGSSNTSYTTSSSGATSYAWSITGTGNSISGTGTTGTVTWSPSYSGTATISVTATNSCGTSSSATVNVIVTPTVGTPTTPSGSTSLCFGASPTAYATSATGASSYTWTVTGTGNSISGTGTTGTVTWGSTFIGNATVSVTATNSCGTSSSASTTVLVGGLNGTYTIDNTVSGAANLYPNTTTFSSFASAVTALACGVTGPVVFNVAAHTYNEQVILPATEGAIPGASSTNTITFNGGTGNAANVILTSAGTSSNYAELTFDGCSYVTFENMTITNTSATALGGVLFYSTSSSYIVTNDRVLNCIVNVPTTGSYGILFSNSQTSAGSSSTAVVENCTISGCTINNGGTGIYMYGFVNTTTPSTEDVVSNCTISNYSTDGIFIADDLTAFKIRGNTFTNGANSGANTEPIRTILEANSSSSTDNAEISGNTLYNFGEFGIGLQGTSGSAAYPMEIFNNYVGGGLPPTGTATNIVTGVYCNGASSYINFWNNTFDENNNSTCSSSYPAVWLDATSSSGHFVIENNIFEYSGTGVSPTYGYPLLLASNVLTGSTIDYNIFYNTNSTAYEENINGTYYTSATVVGGGGINAHSQVINPNFVSTTYTSPDLDITAQCQRGTAIASPPGFTTDIHGNTRSTTSPCIGADEIPSSAPTLSGVTQSAAVCTGTSATINLSGLLYNASTGNTYTVDYTINGVAQTPASVTASSGGTGSFTVAVTSANNGQVLAVTSLTNTSTTCSSTFSSSNSVTLSVNPVPGTPTTPSGTTSLCFGASPTAYTTSATNATSYTWSVTGTGNSISGTGTTGTVTWSPTFTGNATVSVTANNSCGSSVASSSVTVFVGGLNGTYTINSTVVGAANLYPNTTTFNSFASAIAALSCGITGQVIFNVSPGTYTGNISVPSFNGAGVNNDSVIFNGGSAASCFLQEASYGNNGYLVELNSCSYVTFENFTLETNLTAGYTFDGVIIEGSNSSSPISHDDVINCTINMLSESAAVSLGGGTFSGIVVNGFMSGDGNIPNISGYFSNIYLSGNTITNGHYGIVAFGSGATPSGITITGNTITGFSTFGLDMLNLVCPKIRNNTINGCVVSNLAEAIGMNTAANQSSTTDWVEISGNNITTYGRYGILLNGACGNSSQPTRIYNNMVYSSSTLTAARGISTLNSTFSPGNSYINYWNNTIVLNTSSTATSGALTLDNGAANSDIRNNIMAFVGSTAGLPVVIPTIANVTAFDYNIFYNSAATNEGSIGGTTYTSATILNNNYGGSTTFNTNSQVTNPNFVSLTDLDITLQCQRGTSATLTVVPKDIHGTTRANPPCIGADEIPSSTPTLSGVTQSAAVCTGTNATINLSGLLYSSSTGNTYTVNYTINGVAQTPTSVTASSAGTGSFTVAVTSANNGQVLAITGLTNTSTTCSNTFSSGNSVTLSVNPVPGTPTTPSGTTSLCFGAGQTTYTTSATNATSYTWTVTGTGNSISGTGTTGTVTWSSTFIGNATVSVTANNSCGSSVSSSSVTVLVGGLNGTYTIDNTVVGAANLYPNTTTFNSFGSAVAALACGVTGPVVFNVAAHTYSEQVILPATEGVIPGASSTNTVTFNGGAGNAANVILTGAGTGSNYATLTLDGCSYVTFENMTIANTSSSGNGWGVLFYSNAHVVNYDQLQNCIITVPTGTTTGVEGIIFSGSTTAIATGTTGAVGNCIINGCTINNGYYGIYMYGFSNSLTTENVISNCSILNGYAAGIDAASGGTAFKFRGNTISDGASSNPTGYFGIRLTITSSISSSTDYSEISGNTIYAFTEIGLGLQASFGSAAYPTHIFNNFIGGGINNVGTPPQMACVYATSSAGYIDFWHNTLSLNVSGVNSSSAALEIGSSSNQNWSIENNIFSYTGSSTTNGQPMYSSSGTLGSSTVNYNIFYNPTNTSLESTISGTAYTSSTTIGGGGFNGNSQVVNPLFVNTSVSTPDLDVTAQCQRGIYLSAVPTDIHNITRANPPTIGADEIPSSLPTLTGVSQASAVCSGTNATINLSGLLYYAAATNSYAVNYTINGVAQTPAIVSSNSSGAGSFTVAVTSANNGQTLAVTGLTNTVSGCANTFSTNNSTTLSVNPLPGTPVTPTGTITLCQGSSPTAYTTSATNASSYTWTVTGTGNSVSGTGTTGIVTWGPAFSGAANVTVTASNGCGTSSSSSALAITLNTGGTWVGATSADWLTTSNWCGGLPTATTDVMIPGATFVPNEPILQFDPPPAPATGLCHNLTINSGATVTINSNGYLDIYGSITNNGTFTNTSSGGVDFKGSSLQTIPSLTFYNDSINGTGGVSITGNITVNNVLNLINGIVTTGTNSVIVSSNAPTAVVSGTGNTNYLNSWVNGNLQRAITSNTSNYDFPVGNSTYSEFVQLKNNSLAGVNSLTAYFGPKPGTDAGLNVLINGVALTVVNSTGVWHLNPNLEPTNGSYSLLTYFGNDPGWSSRPDEAFTIITRPDASSNAAQWTAPGTIPATGAPGRSFASGYAERDGFTSFSQYGIGEYTGTPLPITLVNFNAVKDGPDALCTWQTASEENTDHFEVEVNTDTTDEGFHSLGSVKAHGNSTTLQTYNFLDTQPGKWGIRYYRLKIVDQNGDYTYSNIVAVDFNTIEQRAGSLYPNPANTFVYYSIYENTNSNVTISVFDVTGRELIMNSYNCPQGVNTFTTNILNLPQGMYILQYQDESGIIDQKFEKF